MAYNPIPKNQSKYRIHTVQSLWSDKKIWMATAPREWSRLFSTWEQAARHLEGVHADKANHR